MPAPAAKEIDMKRMLPGVLILLAAGTLGGAAPAAASVFCGCNGVVKLSFTAGPDLQSVLTTEPAADGLLHVEVWAVLDEVVEVEGPGGVFLHVGGFELELEVAGTEPVDILKQLRVPALDFGPRPTAVWAGLTEPARLQDGRLTLVRWLLKLPGDARDVRLDLTASQLLSCNELPDCPETDVRALYIGSVEIDQGGMFFGASCLPAYVNPSVDPASAPAGCTESFAEFGVFRRR
jgi:hypothetical protein